MYTMNLETFQFSIFIIWGILHLYLSRYKMISNKSKYNIWLKSYISVILAFKALFINEFKDNKKYLMIIWTYRIITISIVLSIIQFFISDLI